MDDIERLQARQDAADLDATRPDVAASDGAPTILAKTTTATTYPTAAARYYAVIPQDVTGAETEGGTGTVTANPGTFRALNVGAAIPPAGTAVICHWVAHRWIFNY